MRKKNSLFICWIGEGEEKTHFQQVRRSDGELGNRTNLQTHLQFETSDSNNLGINVH